MAIDPDDPDHVYAGTVDGLYESTDRGATWHRLPGVSGLVAGLVLAPAGGQLFAQLQDGVVVVPLRP